MPDKAYCSALYLEKYYTFVFKLFKNIRFFSPLLFLSFSALFQISLQFPLLSQCTPMQHQFDVIIKVLEIKAAASCSLEIWSLTNKLVSSASKKTLSPYLCFPANRVLAGMQLKKENQSVLCCLISEEWHWAARVWRWGTVNTETSSWIPLSSLVSKWVWFIKALEWEGGKAEIKGSEFF